jgi:uncharacterized protein
MDQAEPLNIERESLGQGRGRYVARFESGLLAELTYYDLDGAVRVMDHTRVPQALEGRGIASQLVSRAVSDADGEGQTIRPDCSYVAAWLKRHRRT